MDIKHLKQFALIIAITVAAAAGGFAGEAHEQALDQDLIALATVKDAASITGDQHLELKDHYGNPAHFTQYIIRIPPVHA